MESGAMETLPTTTEVSDQTIPDAEIAPKEETVPSDAEVAAETVPTAACTMY
jgi:hypothetical protein